MNERTGAAMRVSWVTLLINAALSLMKLAAGLFGHSGAMISDAIHSASDVFSTLIVMVGLRLSEKSADRQHPYGHERLECVAALLLSGMLLLTGLSIGKSGVEQMLAQDAGDRALPGLLPLIMAVVSILVKELMFRYTRDWARRTQSDALMADAWHHRSDALSSVGAFVGIAGARRGLPWMDPLASVVICVFIVKAAVDIFRETVDKLVDHSCDPAMEERMRKLVLGFEGVRGIDLLRTRQFGSRAYADIEIRVDGSLTLTQAHAIAEAVHEGVEKGFPEVKHISVHVNPA